MDAAAKSWRTNAGLFLVTAASVFVTGAVSFPAEPASTPDQGVWDALKHAFGSLSGGGFLHGAQFAATVLTILGAHELGHYVAARIHRVEASLPYFIPLPLLSPFGTMGAVIRMRGTIPTRRALLDIGASGPLAGLVFAIPLYAWGVAHSKVVPLDPTSMFELGEPVLVRVLDHFFAPAAPEGMTIAYSPVAFGAWGGFFVTMINLLPVGQLDGGHIAYALFGPRQDRIARTAHRAMLVFFCVALAGHVLRDLQSGRAITAALMARHIGNGLFWLVWFQVLVILGTLARRGEDAPEGALSTQTRVLALVGLVLVSSFARAHASWLLVGAFFGALGLLVAMELRGGVFREHTFVDHPPTGPEPLDGKRIAIALLSLALFGLLFMPEPFSL